MRPERSQPQPGEPTSLDNRALLANVAAPVLLLSGDGRVQDFNPPAAAVAGLDDAARGRPLADFLREPAAADELRSVLASLGPDAATAAIRIPATAPGSETGVTWVARAVLGDEDCVSHIVCTADSWNGSPGMAAATDADAEHAVVLSNISDAVFITDDDGRFTFICPNVHVIFGHSLEEVRRMGRIDRLLGGELADVARELVQLPEIANLERRIRDKHQNEHVLLVNIKRVAIRGGTRLYTCRDITERRQIEARLRAAQAELVHATRRSTVGELASGIAHELNQPLSAISNYATACTHLIRAGRGTPDQLLRPLEQIAAQSHRAASIVQRVRRFLQKQPARRTVIRVDALLREALALLQAGIDSRDVEIRLDVPASLPSVQVDAIGIQQVIINLVLNAVDAVRSKGGASGQPIMVSAAPAAESKIEFAVRDHGPGLSPSQLEQVFEPLFTTKPEGTGLGLSISRSIVEAHGGELWATSEPDGGAAFRFTLPLAHRPPDGSGGPGQRLDSHDE